MNWDIKTAYKTLKKDPVMKEVISITGELTVSKSKELYESLLYCVVSQQLSVKAADTIWSRVQAKFPNKDMAPHLILQIDKEQLRACGLSYQKAGYLKNIAEFTQSNTLEYSKLKSKSDDFLIDYLSQIKGIGRWSAEMILMFSLNRPNILPVDDIGIQSSLRNLYGLSDNKKEMILEMQQIASSWEPYRTLACRHLWRFRDQ
jgi:DNA-3-methyladenine glycosylase II